MYLKIENEFNVYCKAEEMIRFSAGDDNEKKNLELNLSMMKSQIKGIEGKRKKLQEYVYTQTFDVAPLNLFDDPSIDFATTCYNVVLLQGLHGKRAQGDNDEAERQ